MRDLNDLYYFTQVVEHGGFSAAGRALGLPKSKLSRRVAQLEDGLGVRLLQRSSRRFALTEFGQAYYRHCRAMVIEAEAAEEAVQHSQAEPQGLIRLSCPVAVAQSKVGPIIARFLADHPRVRIHLEATNRRVDVIEEGFDLAIRVRMPPLEDSGLIIKVLERHQGYLVGAPDLLDRLGRPQSPDQLSALPSLGMTRAGDRHSWQLEHFHIERPYPSWAKKLAHSSGGNRSMSFPITSHKVLMVRACAFRSRLLSLAKASSMGLRSGE
ncbi:putative transcriptional regulator [Magnetospirillum gryphiswaldense MSR-1 v2]|uniref:Transcriptional regulator n=1 Tax=Magnetospirillum gryphiswaldense (strain DSM 6361 / JCM 21280 / NBRC 15271 / MSR-1) TaxID=431944 RepID=V6F136_MAGGM|nr:putative transcriptional regulator [Magnetospirillum gryphiswaldense MSR-1 v2]